MFVFQLCYFFLASSNCACDILPFVLNKASLPLLFKTVDQAPIAWWTSVASALADPLIFKLRHGLQEFTAPAFDFIQRMLGGPECCFWTQVSTNFPSGSETLSTGSFYNPSNPPRTKLNKLVLQAVRKRKAALLSSLLSPTTSTATLSLKQM